MKKIFLLFSALLISQINFAQDTIVKRNGDLIRAKVTEINTLEVKYKKFDYQDGPTYVEKKSEIELIKYSSGLREHFERTNNVPANTNRATQNEPDYYGGQVAVNPPVGNKISEFGSRYRVQNGIISEREMHSILMNTNDKHIMGLVQQSKQAHGLQFVGFAAIPIGIAAVYCLAFSMDNQGTYNSQTGTYNNTTNPNKNSLQAAAAVFGIVAIGCPIASGVFKARRKEFNREAINLYNQKY